MVKPKNYKDLYFDIESGELRSLPDKKIPETVMSIIIPESTPLLQSYRNSSRVPVFGLGVTNKFLDENCLKPGDKCKRFHAVSLSESRIQAVMCRNGPYKRCEKAKGGR